MAMSETRETRHTVNMVRSDYQPSKVELEEPVEIPRHDGTQPTLEELARAAHQPVSVNWTHRP